MNRSAFQVHSIAGQPGLHPLSFTFDEVEQGIWRASLHAQSVSEGAGLLANYAKDLLCVYDVGSHWYDADRGEMLSVHDIVDRQGVTALVADPDLVVLRTGDLAEFLTGWDHYDMSLFDLPEDLPKDEVPDLVLTAMDVDWPAGESVLQSLKNSDVFLGSHDDCYLQVESRRMAHIKDHLRYLLKHFASAIVDAEVSAPPLAVIDEYLARHRSLSSFSSDVQLAGGVLEIPCSPEPVSFVEDRTYSLAATMRVDLAVDAWSMEFAV